MHCSLVSKVAGSVRVLVAGEELKHLGFLFVLDVGKRMRKPVHRRTVDYSSTVVRYIQVFPPPSGLPLQKSCHGKMCCRQEAYLSSCSALFSLMVDFVFFVSMISESPNDSPILKGLNKWQVKMVTKNESLLMVLQTRMWQRDVRDAPVLQPCSAAAIDVSGNFELGFCSLNLCTFSVALVNTPHSKHLRLKRFCQGVVDEVSDLGRCTMTAFISYVAAKMLP